MSLTQSPEYAWRVQADFSYSAGAVSIAPLQVFFRSDITDGTTVEAQPDSDPAMLEVDLVLNGTKAIDGGRTYAQILADLQAVIALERAAQLAPPTG